MLEHPKNQLLTWKYHINQIFSLMEGYKPAIQPLIQNKTVLDWGCHIGTRSYVLNQWGAKHVYCWDPFTLCEANFKRHFQSNTLTWVDNFVAPFPVDVLYLSNIHNVVGKNPFLWFNTLLKSISCDTVLATWEHDLSEIKEEVFTDFRLGHLWFSTEGYNYYSGDEVYKSDDYKIATSNKTNWRGSPLNLIILNRI
jgi:hypothetical protein